MLGDILANNLKVVICGTSVGFDSNRQGHYYSGRTNRFWKTLFNSGITPVLLTPHEDSRLNEFGVGLTDLVKVRAGTDQDLVNSDFDIASFEQAIRKYEPGVVCFNGKLAAERVLGRRRVEYCFQPERFGNTRLFVAPSTSGAANRWWNEEIWLELGEWLAAQNGRPAGQRSWVQGSSALPGSGVSPPSFF